MTKEQAIKYEKLKREIIHFYMLKSGNVTFKTIAEKFKTNVAFVSGALSGMFTPNTCQPKDAEVEC